MNKALILAAGSGSRLMPLTADRPKCLVELGGKALLDWQFESLRSGGVDAVSMVVGYKQEAIRAHAGPKLESLYENADFATTNMVETLIRARSCLESVPAGGTLLLAYGDIVYAPDIVSALLKDPSDISVAVDLEWLKLWSARTENPLLDAETLRMDSQRRLLEIGQKPKTLEEIQAQYLGLVKLSRKGIDVLLASYDRASREIAAGRTAWGRVTNLQKAYMTDLLQGLVLEGADIRALPIRRGWIEVDTLDDHAFYADELKKHPGKKPFEILS